MAVVISADKNKTATKSKGKVKSASKSALKKQGVLVDKAGKLKGKIEKATAKLKPVQERYSECMGELLPLIDATNKAEDKAVVAGEVYTVNATAKGNKTTLIDKQKVVEMLEAIEPGLFFKLASIGVTDLKKYLTPDQLEVVVSTEATNARRVSFKPTSKK